MTPDLRIEVYRAQVVPYRWYWRIVGPNGKALATSESHREKYGAEEQATKMAERLGVRCEVKPPCVI